MARVVAVLLIIGVGAWAQAAEPRPPYLYELQGPRQVALGGAERASGTSNDTIWLNPAALGDSQRYTFSFDGLYDLRGNHDQAGLSVADSTTTPVAAGLAAHRVWMGPSGSVQPANVFNLALATHLGDLVTLGESTKLIHTRDATGSHNQVTPDLALFVNATPVKVGLVAYNLVNPIDGLAPRQFAVAVSANLPQLPRLEADVVFDPTTQKDVTLAYHFGAEYDLLSMLALRAGYVEDRILGQRAISGGIGFFIPPGFGLDITYRHELLGSEPERALVLGVNLGI